MDFLIIRFKGTGKGKREAWDRNSQIPNHLGDDFVFQGEAIWLLFSIKVSL